MDYPTNEEIYNENAEILERETIGNEIEQKILDFLNNELTD